MSIGSSGRIVIEIEPELKRRLYAALSADGFTLKGWFLVEAQAYIQKSTQPDLPFGEDAEKVDVGGRLDD